MDSDRHLLADAKRIIVKLGTGILTAQNGGLDARQVNHFASQIAAIHRARREIVLVSSGAIGAGMARLNLKQRPVQIAELQTCAAIGQNLLMSCYDRAFTRRNMTVAQILLTHEDFLHPQRRHNARPTLLHLLQHRAVPIINENDAVSFDEIKFGDNDQLASLVQELLHADACILLSNVDGFMVPDGRRQRILPTVRHITADLASHARGPASERSVGGMKSKLLAAEKVLATHRPLVIANGRTPRILSRLLKGEPLGTVFLP